MKLDKSCCFFNAEIGEGGNTANWTTALNQQGGDHSFNDDVKREFYENIKQYFIQENEGKDLYAAAKTRTGPEILGVAVLKQVYYHGLRLSSFIVAVIKDVQGSHVGRIRLKINHDFQYDGKNNQMVYDQIQNSFGEKACWFLDSMHFEGEKIILSPILVSSQPKTYSDANIKAMHWHSLTGDYSKIKNAFSKYLINDVKRIKTQSTVNEYLAKLKGPVFDWFKENNIVTDSFEILNIYSDIDSINNQLEGPLHRKWKEINKEVNGFYGAPWNRWCEFIGSLNLDQFEKNKEYEKSLKGETVYERKQHDLVQLSIDGLYKSCSNAGLDFDLNLLKRFIASLQAKPFIILSGLSGSGKTKLAESFAMYISENADQWMLVPVGADWTNRDSLLGFENTLTNSYSLPPHNVPEFISRASQEENRDKPYFLILDEMNLSVVERYFADFLSAMESSNKEISLHQIEKQANDKKKLPPAKLKLPTNLFIIGTVNIDESTYMFSPKVLDRANTIEFRLNKDDVEGFLNMDLADLDLDELAGKGKKMATSFLKNCRKELDMDLIKNIDDLLIKTFKPLKKAGAEFGYRTITEIRQLATQLNQFEIESEEARNDENSYKKAHAIFDIVILQKLLPKLHGSVGKLKIPLTTLAELCFDEGKWDTQYLDANNDFGESSETLRYPKSFEKIKSMYVRLSQNGFVSFAEA